MEFRIYKTKSDGFKPFYDAKYDAKRKCFIMEVNSIEELLLICDIAGHELVIGYEDEPYIEINNAPREQHDETDIDISEVVGMSEVAFMSQVTN